MGARSTARRVASSSDSAGEAAKLATGIASSRSNRHALAARTNERATQTIWVWNIMGPPKRNRQKRTAHGRRRFATFVRGLDGSDKRRLGKEGVSRGRYRGRRDN